MPTDSQLPSDPPVHSTECSASLPPVLDACYGSRMFWFDRKDSRAVFVDKRRESHTLPLLCLANDLDQRPGQQPKS